MLQEIKTTKEMITQADQSFFDLKKTGSFLRIKDNERTDLMRARLLARVLFKSIYPTFSAMKDPFCFEDKNGDVVDIRAITCSNRPHEKYHVMVKGTQKKPKTYYFIFVHETFETVWIAGWFDKTKINQKHERKQGQVSSTRSGYTYKWDCWEIRVSELSRGI